jgi:hypothetical protein
MTTKASLSRPGTPCASSAKTRDQVAPHHAADLFAGLVADLALIERRLQRLRSEEVRQPLELADGTLSPDELERQLDEHRLALLALASHLQATTREGTIMQALAALEIDLSEGFPVQFRESAAGWRFRGAKANVERILYSIAYSDDEISEDLKLLRDTIAPRGFHGIAQVNGLAA